MGTLHFSIGEDLGIRLAEIARDHIYKLDVEKSLSIWKDAFGCPDNLTNRLTTGQLVVTVDDTDKGIVNVCKRSELSEDRQKEYPEITRDDVVRLIEKNFRDYVDHRRDWILECARDKLSKVENMHGIWSVDFLINDTDTTPWGWDLWMIDAADAWQSAYWNPEIVKL